MQIVNEGEEPDKFFWDALGGKKTYETVRWTTYWITTLDSRRF